jgi:hypothetical protein
VLGLNLELCANEVDSTRRQSCLLYSFGCVSGCVGDLYSSVDLSLEITADSEMTIYEAAKAGPVIQSCDAARHPFAFESKNKRRMS